MICILTYLLTTYHVPMHRAWPLASKIDHACTRIERARETEDFRAEERAGDDAVSIIEASGVDVQLDELCGE